MRESGFPSRPVRLSPDYMYIVYRYCTPRLRLAGILTVTPSQSQSQPALTDKTHCNTHQHTELLYDAHRHRQRQREREREGENRERGRDRQRERDWSIESFGALRCGCGCCGCCGGGGLWSWRGGCCLTAVVLDESDADGGCGQGAARDWVRLHGGGTAVVQHMRARQRRVAT